MRSGRESDVSSRPKFECGGELCGLRITGTSEAEVWTGRGFGDNKCICETGLGGVGVSSEPVRSMPTLSITVGLTQLHQIDECMREPRTRTRRMPTQDRHRPAPLFKISNYLNLGLVYVLYPPPLH
jgi:hypothetical protein